MKTDAGNTRRAEVPRIEGLHVRNFRALRDLTLKDLKPLTVLVGPNGSGKSTLFDVFAFLADCFSIGLRKAWDKRGRFRELRSRGEDGPIVIELKYREEPRTPLITYHLEIGETDQGPVLETEWLQWRRGQYGKPYRFLNFRYGRGDVIEGEVPDEQASRIEETLDSAETLAANTLGQLARHPRVASLRRFITGWYLSYLSADSARGVPEAGAQERLSQSGHNLPNVIQYLKEQHPDRLEQMLAVLRQRVPRLDRVDTQILADGRLLLRFKDAPFEQPVLAKYVSDGTLKMLSYLTVLYDPDPPPLVGVEEPENYLHPRLLPGLAEECRKATQRSQVLVTTHSPSFVNALAPVEVWVVFRDESGFTQATRTSEMTGIPHLVDEGGKLGDLWMEGFLDAGDPLYSGTSR